MKTLRLLFLSFTVWNPYFVIYAQGAATQIAIALQASSEPFVGVLGGLALPL